MGGFCQFYGPFFSHDDLLGSSESTDNSGEPKTYFSLGEGISNRKPPTKQVSVVSELGHKLPQLCACEGSQLSGD